MGIGGTDALVDSSSRMVAETGTLGPVVRLIGMAGADDGPVAGRSSMVAAGRELDTGMIVAPGTKLRLLLALGLAGATGRAGSDRSASMEGSADGTPGAFSKRAGRLGTSLLGRLGKPTFPNSGWKSS